MQVVELQALKHDEEVKRNDDPDSLERQYHITTSHRNGHHNQN
jgi:hypothetical protein